MVTSDSERILDDWATAWSSHDTEKVLALFIDEGIANTSTLQRRSLFCVSLAAAWLLGERGAERRRSSRGVGLTGGVYERGS